MRRKDMNEDRNGTKFNTDLINNLKKIDFTKYEENIEMKKNGKYGSQPDVVAIKDNIALIIETKSECEAGKKGCLVPKQGSPNHKYYNTFKNWREYCKSLPDKSVAVWMVHINLQALYYPIVFQKSYGWEMKEKKDNDALKECTWIPAFAFPESYKQDVLEAIDRMGITLEDQAIIEFDSYQILIKFDRGQKMVEPAPNIRSSKS